VTATTVDADGLSIPVTVGVRAVGTTTNSSESVTAEHTPAHADPGSLLTPIPETDPVTVGESTTVAIDAQYQMGPVPDLDSITVSLSTPCAAEMSGGAVADRFEGTATVADDGTAVTLDFSAFPNGADRHGTVATVEIAGQQASHTRVVIDTVTTASDGHVGTEWATLGVEDPVPTIPGGLKGPAPAIDGTVPGDIDGDGLHEDLTGDGEISFPDVNTFFQNSDADVVQNNADIFDFNEDGSINLQDVMALFRLV